MICLTACDKPDVTEPDDKQEQTGNSGNENGETPSEGEGEGETEKVKSMTITLEKVTATKAYFKASTKKTAPDIEIGIYYSQYAGDHIYDCERVWDYDLENGECELVIEDLDANTTYYYRPYLFIDGTRELGDELSFTTADYSFNVDVTVNGQDVTFSGYADIWINSFGYISYWTEPQMINCIGRIGPIKRGEFSYTVTDLSDNTTYYYRMECWMPNGWVYGDMKSFTTEDFVTIVPSGYSNLSDVTTANCYIVSQNGSYCFLVAKGNQSSALLYRTESASLLWESFGTSTTPSVGDLINSVSYSDGYITFQTADTFKEGNAVIAAKDADGNILWSWHIWLTDEPQEHIYRNNAGTMMDRNLGATSVTPGDVGALGLLYQWGRKDPFLGSSSISEEVEASSTIIWPDNVKTDSNTRTIEYTIANPTTFIGNWDYDDGLWRSEKTIYDPCPAGWRVPEGGNNGVWATANFNEYTVYYDYTNNGCSFRYNLHDKTWYPASGCRSYDGLDFEDSYGDNFGVYWAVSCGLRFSSDGDIDPSSHFAPGAACSVRCLKE